MSGLAGVLEIAESDRWRQMFTDHPAYDTVMTMADRSRTTPSGRRKKAVAIRYDPAKDAAPVAVGKGIGLTAERIITLAREHGIPIHEDADLVEILAKLELHEQIPPVAYVAVAEILAFIYRTNDKYKS